eukprot:scaffold63082_cov54-Attheya_sp.AAC.4
MSSNQDTTSATEEPPPDGEEISSEKGDSAAAMSENEAAASQPASPARGNDAPTIPVVSSSVAVKGKKVKVHFCAVGSAPLMKKTKFQIGADQSVSYVLAFLRKMLKLSHSGDSLFLYVNSAFCPSPDESIGELNDCFSIRGELVIHYSLQEAWVALKLKRNLLHFLNSPYTIVLYFVCFFNCCWREIGHCSDRGCCAPIGRDCVDGGDDPPSHLSVDRPIDDDRLCHDDDDDDHDPCHNFDFVGVVVGSERNGDGPARGNGDLHDTSDQTFDDSYAIGCDYDFDCSLTNKVIWTTVMGIGGGDDCVSRLANDYDPVRIEVSCHSVVSVHHCPLDAWGNCHGSHLRNFPGHDRHCLHASSHPWFYCDSDSDCDWHSCYDCDLTGVCAAGPRHSSVRVDKSLRPSGCVK